MFNRPTLILTIVILALLAMIPDAEAFHHPRLGQFLQRDAVEYNDDMSLYQYELRKPMSYTDPSGHVVILAHGADGAEWYPAATDKIKRALKANNLDEEVVQFRYPLLVPKVNLRFGAKKLTIDGFNAFNAAERQMGGNPLADALMLFMDLAASKVNGVNKEKTKGVVISGLGKEVNVPVQGVWSVDTDLIQWFLKYNYPTGKSMNLYVGSVNPVVEAWSGILLANEMRRWKQKCPNEPIRFLGFSSGVRVLDWAYFFGAPKADRVVMAGATVSWLNTNIVRHSGKVINYHGVKDYISMIFPYERVPVRAVPKVGPAIDKLMEKNPVPVLGPAINEMIGKVRIPMLGGAGTWGLYHADKNNYDPNMFHGDWMQKGGMVAKYANDLVN